MRSYDLEAGGVSCTVRGTRHSGVAQQAGNRQREQERRPAQRLHLKACHRCAAPAAAVRLTLQLEATCFELRIVICSPENGEIIRMGPVPCSRAKAPVTLQLRPSAA